MRNTFLAGYTQSRLWGSCTAQSYFLFYLSSYVPGVSFPPFCFLARNPDETILYRPSGTYFQTINLAPEKHLTALTFQSGRKLSKKSGGAVNYCQKGVKQTNQQTTLKALF